MRTLALVFAAATFALAACSSESSAQKGASAIFSRIGPKDPYCSAAVRRGDKIVYARAFGSTRRGRATTKTTGDIASVSKQFTGVAAELLIDRGQLTGDSVISDLVPASAPASNGITVNELLTHTSGLADYTDLLDETPGKPTTQQDAIAAIAKSKTTGTRGRFQYSNSNYILLAEVVKAVSGQPLPKFLDAEVFRPLNLKMQLTPRGLWRQVGDGSIWTTPTQLVNWSAQYWNQTLPGPNLRQVMFDPESKDGSDRYGSGVERSVTDDGVELLFHDGSWGRYDTNWAVIPSERLAAAVTCDVAAKLKSDAAAEVLLELWRADP